MTEPLTPGTRGDLRALPPLFADNARRFYAEKSRPVQARAAATVLLLRDSVDGMEVFMIRRAATMAFAAGLYAFPGGSAEERDADIAATAARELREETGISSVELRAWSRWITPEFEPRRYDTWFYVAALPQGQQPANLGSEADRTTWIAPAAALERYGASMLPPTAVTLAELNGHPSTDAVLSASLGRDLTPILPRVNLSADPPHMCIPGDLDYPGGD